MRKQSCSLVPRYSRRLLTAWAAVQLALVRDDLRFRALESTRPECKTLLKKASISNEINDKVNLIRSTFFALFRLCRCSVSRKKRDILLFHLLVFIFIGLVKQKVVLEDPDYPQPLIIAEMEMAVPLFHLLAVLPPSFLPSPQTRASILVRHSSNPSLLCSYKI